MQSQQPKSLPSYRLCKHICIQLELNLAVEQEKACVYIYIYIERERERRGGVREEQAIAAQQHTAIYTCICTRNTYIYIHRERERERERERRRRTRGACHRRSRAYCETTRKRPRQLSLPPPLRTRCAPPHMLSRFSTARCSCRRVAAYAFALHTLVA